MVEGNFNLRKWKSNSAELMEIIGEEDIGQECKVLGISWNKANDEFVFELAKFASGFIEMAVTKTKGCFCCGTTF